MVTMNGLYDTRSRRIRQNMLILSTRRLSPPNLGTHVAYTRQKNTHPAQLYMQFALHCKPNACIVAA